MTKRKAFFYAATFIIIVSSVLLFDVVAYFFLPDGAIAFAPDYRNKEQLHISAANQNMVDLPRGYPRGYFMADPVLGFDITPNVEEKPHFFGDAVVNVFSNELGCFDRNGLPQIRKEKNYDYFAGDSFTWGYALYEKKFTTVYEASSGRISVKCGVTHTGQLHQFEKFRRIVKTIGHYPSRVFVGYYNNDPANDYTHPHTTVIDGFQVDTVEMRNGALAQRNLENLKESVEKFQTENSGMSQESDGIAADAKRILKHYSLTINLANFFKEKSLGLLKKDGPESLYHLRHQYDFNKNYLSNPITQKNRDIINRWKNDANDHGYELVFILIPPKDAYNDENFYASLKTYLSSINIEYFDLTKPFHDNYKSMFDLYWRTDGHLNNAGNEFLGNLLAKRYKQASH